MSIPDEIRAFHDAIARLPGVVEVDSGIRSLDGIREDDLRLAGPFADLPHAVLRRTKGGLPNEAYLQFELKLRQDAAGWRALEFLAWFVRDAARAGEPIQLRPFAAPPQGAGGVVQIGRTLRFHIDLFWLDAGEDLAPILERIASLASALVLASDLYGITRRA